MIKNRTFLLIAANLLLGIFIILNFENEDDQEFNLNSEFSEMISKMQLVELSKPTTKQKIVLKKEQVDWQITQPVTWPAEPIAIANLISKISHLETTFVSFLEELEAKAEIPQDYGFDENASSFRFVGKTSEIQITIGSLTRDHDGRFILVDNGETKTIWHTPRQIDDLVNRPLNEWARLTFFGLPIYSIDELMVKEIVDGNQLEATTVSKTGDKWLFASPMNRNANSDEILSLLHKLITEKVVGFAEKDADNNLTKALEINIQAMGKKHSLVFYKTNEQEVSKLLVKSSYLNHLEQDFYISTSFIDHFRGLASKLREKRLFSLEMDTINRIRIVENNSSLTIRKNENNSWIGLENNGTDTFSFRADLELVQEFFHKLNAVEVTKFIDFDPDSSKLRLQGFENPQLRLEVELTDSTKKNILISKSNSESTFWSTYVTDEAFTCLVNSDWNKLLSVKAIHYKDRGLLPAQFECEKIILTSQTTGEVLASMDYESKGESFDRLLGFKADYFVDLSYNEDGLWVDGDWLPWKYSIRFENSDISNTGHPWFNLTERVGGTKWYAGSEELGLVCNLPIFIIDELEKELIDKEINP